MSFGLIGQNITHHNLPAVRAQELLKPSKDVKGFVVLVEKQIGEFWI